MAEPSNPLTLGEFGTLRDALLQSKKTMQPLGKLGVDFRLGAGDVLMSMTPFGNLSSIASAVSQQQANQLAKKLDGQPTDSFLGTVFGTDLSDFTNLKADVEREYGKNFTRQNVTEYLQNKSPDTEAPDITTFARSLPDIPEGFAFRDLNMSNPDDAKQMVQGKIYAVTNPFKTQSFANTFREYQTTIDPDTGEKLFSTDYIPQEVIDANLKSPDEFADDKITQSNIGQRDAEGNFIPSKTYDKNFARAVTLEQQADTTDAKGTFICTALYDQGLLPRKIYLCDVIYGKNINFYTYKGYTTWGKWVAKKLANKKMVYKIFYRFFVQWANQMAFEVSGGKYGKNNRMVKLIKRVGEAISYSVGWISERRTKWQNTK